MESFDTLLTGTRKETLEQRKAKLDDVQKDYDESQLKFNNNVDDLNGLKEKNRLNADTLSEKSKKIAGRGAIASGAVSVIDFGKSALGQSTEAELFRAEDDALKESQKKAIQMQNDLADEYVSLKEKEEELKEEKARYLRSEKNALKKELKETKQELKSLEERKKSSEVEGEESSDIDQKIEASNQKINKLDEAREKNQAAAADVRSDRKQSSSSPVQSCPELCEAHDIVVMCQHNSRKASLVPGGKVPELHVLSASYGANSGSVDTIRTYVSGSCGKGLTTTSPVSGISNLLERYEENSHCPYIIVKGDRTKVAQPGTSGNPLQFDAYSPDIDWGPSFLSKPTWYVFFQNVFLKKEKEKFTQYTLEGCHCDSNGINASAIVCAHTHEKWVLEAAVGRVAPAGKTENVAACLDSDSVVEIEPEKADLVNWRIEGKVAGSLDTKNFSLETGFDAFKGVREALSHLLAFFDVVDSDSKPKKEEGAIFTWELIQPKIALAAEREYKENENNNMVDKAYKYALKLDPLIGVKANVDVLQALIIFGSNFVAPGCGKGAKHFIGFVKEVLKKSQTALDKANTKVDFKAEIVFETELVAAGELNCSKVYEGDPVSEMLPVPSQQTLGTTPEKKSSTSGAAEIAAVCKFSLKGVVKAEVEHTNSWFEVQAAVGAGLSVGAKGGGPSELSLKVMLEISNGEPDFKGEVEFKGLILFFLSYAEASLKKAKTKADDKGGLTNGGLVGNGGVGAPPGAAAPGAAPPSPQATGLKNSKDPEAKRNDSKELWTIFKPSKKPFWEN